MSQQLRQNQIRGLYSESLDQDISSIVSKAQTYDAPVRTKTDLPLEGNNDGDIRLVLDEDIFYVWDEPTTTWIAKLDKRTETRTSIIPITVDGQLNFTTDLSVGIVNGISSMETVMLMVNGMNQIRNVDYEIGVTGQAPPKLIITWKSNDFQLDTTDNLSVVYDILLTD